MINEQNPLKPHIEQEQPQKVSAKDKIANTMSIGALVLGVSAIVGLIASSSPSYPYLKQMAAISTEGTSYKKIAADITNENFATYYTDAINGLHEANAELNNYSAKQAVTLFLDGNYAFMEQGQFTSVLSYDFDGVTKKGYFDFNYDEKNRLGVRIPYYQEIKDDSVRSYFEFNGKWYYVDSVSSQDITPAVVSRIGGSLTCYTLPTNEKVTVNAHDWLMRPFSFFVVPECQDSHLYDDSISIDDNKRITSLERSHYLINKSIAQDFIETNKDTVLDVLINQYPTTYGSASVSFENYDAVSKIIIPEQVLKAGPATSDIKKMFINMILDSCSVYEHFIRTETPAVSNKTQSENVENNSVVIEAQEG